MDGDSSTAIGKDISDALKSDCTQSWDAMADAKHPRHEETLWSQDYPSTLNK